MGCVPDAFRTVFELFYHTVESAESIPANLTERRRPVSELTPTGVNTESIPSNLTERRRTVFEF